MRLIIQDKTGVTTFDLPERADGARIMVLANKELLAIRPAGKPWEVKEEPCSFCGQCCLGIDESIHGIDDEGKCAVLLKEGDNFLCHAGADTPIRCLEDPIAEEAEGCTIVRRVVEPK